MFEGFNYSQTEISFFNYLFENNKNPNNNFIDGKEVAQLFMKANLQRDKLKTIWDNSSKRKAQNLTKEEFYYSCRSVALAQMGMELIDHHVKEMNNSNFLPVFHGIQFNPPTTKPVQPIFHLQCNSDPNAHTNNTNQSISKQTNINNKNISTPVEIANNDIEDDEFITIDENTDKEIKPHESIKQVELNIVNSLLKGFDEKQLQKKKEKEEEKANSKPVTQPVVEPFKPKKNLDDLFNLLENDNDEKKNEEEEFVTIEEEGEEKDKIELQIKETITKMPTQFNEIDENKPKKQSKNNVSNLDDIQKPNQEYHTPQSSDNRENKVSSSSNFDLKIDSSKEKQSKTINAGIGMNISITPEINKSKAMSLNGIMNDFKLNKETSINEGIESEIIHQKTIELNNNYIKKYSIDDDFCEVKEDDQTNDNNNTLSKEEDNKSNQFNTNTNQNTNPIDSIISEILRPNKYEIGEPNQDDNKLKIKKEEEEKATEKEEEKKPTHSILNFTQMDFLQEFKKEIKSNISQETEKAQEDDFEFLEVEEQQNSNQSNELQKEFDPIESKLSKLFKSEEEKAKFYSNLKLIFQAINKEYTVIIPLLKQLLPLSELKVSDDTLFKNKRITNFINGIIRLLLFNNKLNGTKEFIKNNKLETNRKQYNEIVSLINALLQSKTFASILDVNKLNELNTTPKIKCEGNPDDNKDCQLCLHSNLNEKITNVFGYDFHIRCINVWLNLIEAKSPFSQ